MASPSRTVDVSNPSTGEDFVLGLKEITLPDGTSRPYSMYCRHHPRALDGLSKLLSLDMLDPAWIGMKLRKLLDYSEPLGDFMAFVPGSRKQQTYPSTVAYIANLIIHRYAMLGILDEAGFPLQQMGILEAPEDTTSNKVLPTLGKLCGECGNHTMIRKDGCDFLHCLRCRRHLRLIGSKAPNKTPRDSGAFCFVTLANEFQGWKPITKYSRQGLSSQNKAVMVLASVIRPSHTACLASSGDNSTTSRNSLWSSVFSCQMQATCGKNLDPFVGVTDAWVHHAKILPHAAAT